jgi:hypothetical protein
MNRIIITAVFGIFLANPVVADEAYWPRTDDSNPFAREATTGQSIMFAADRRAPRKAPAATIDPWNHDYAPYGQAGSMPVAGLQGAFVPSLTSNELDAQIAVNKRYQDQLRQRLIRQGGTNADVLPVWVAADPRVHNNAFGEGKQIGSNGGD